MLTCRTPVANSSQISQLQTLHRVTQHTASISGLKLRQKHDTGLTSSNVNMNQTRTKGQC